MDDDREARREDLEEEIGNAKHQIRRCLLASQSAEKKYNEKYDKVHDSWVSKKEEMERAPDGIREDLQLEVDDLFSAMKRIKENKIEASFDHKLEYDKWCNTLKQKEDELSELDW